MCDTTYPKCTICGGQRGVRRCDFICFNCFEKIQGNEKAWEKVQVVKEKLEAVLSTVKAGAPQINKNRRITVLVTMSLELLRELKEEVSNGV